MPHHLFFKRPDWKYIHAAQYWMFELWCRWRQCSLSLAYATSGYIWLVPYGPVPKVFLGPCVNFERSLSTTIVKWDRWKFVLDNLHPCLSVEPVSTRVGEKRASKFPVLFSRNRMSSISIDIEKCFWTRLLVFNLKFTSRAEFGKITHWYTMVVGGIFVEYTWVYYRSTMHSWQTFV